jgi:tetratricopeptide (TPR) repeat protein
MWDLKAANPSASTRIVARLARGVTTALLTPDGRWLVTAAEGDSVVQLSRWRPEDLAELAEAEGRNLTIEEWEQYFPGLAYRKTFPALPGPLDLPPQAAHGKAHLQRGNEFLARGEFETALDDYTAAIRLDPRNAEALDGRAVIGATAPDESFRDGARAVADAQRACELTDWKEPRYLATLAAAHAETGDFDQAVKWQAKARELADKEQQAEFTDRLKLYQSGSPYRRVPPATP